MHTNARTNAGVAAAWARQDAASTQHLRTDGIDLYSYALRIGTTLPNGRKIIGEFTAADEFHSMTTSSHVGTARRFADEVVEVDVLKAQPTAYEARAERRIRQAERQLAAEPVPTSEVLGPGDLSFAVRHGATARCPECSRVFNLMDDTDAAEWAYGHDCEVIS